MRFEDFIGNAKVITRLRARLRDGKFPHALLFAGPNGVGKRTCALMVAQILNCSEGVPDAFCGACSSCRKIDAGVHPDVVAVGLEDDASEIKIGQIRDVLHTLGLRPLEGRNKVFIIDPADAMNAASANALLKGLEEPPENSTFILLSQNPQSLLVTVRSRCQTLVFTPLTLEEMRSLGGDEFILRWSRGSIGALKTLDAKDLRERRDNALEFLEVAARATEDNFRDLIAVSADLSRSKNEFEGQMDTIAVLLEDVLYLREGLEERVVNIDVRERLSRLSDALAPEQFLRMSDFLRTIEVHSNNYGNRQMLTDVFALTSNAAASKFANDIPAKSR